jgi:hypothetical protein
MKRILVYFLIFNVLVSLPLKFVLQLHEPFKVALVSSLLFSIAWLVIYQIIFIGKLRKIDEISLALGATIGVKFFFTLTIFMILYVAGMFADKISIGIFLVCYVYYTVATAYFSNKQMETLRKQEEDTAK